MKTKVKEKKNAFKKYIKTKGIEDKEKYITARREAKQIVKEAKQQTWIDFGNNLEEKYHTNNKEFWNVINGLRGKRSKGIRNIKDKNNILKTKTGEIQKVRREH